MDNQDLKHRDWLLYSTKRLLQQTGGESISIQIVDLPNDRKVLVASGITESMIDNLQFLVNTDENNNYLYLEDFKVYVDGYFAPLDLSGLRDAVVNAYRACDIDNFLLGNKTHKPFSGANFSTETVTYASFNEYVDAYTNINPYTPNTLGLVKTYQVTMNPDFIKWPSQPGNSPKPNTASSNFTPLTPSSTIAGTVGNVVLIRLGGKAPSSISSIPGSEYFPTNIWSGLSQTIQTGGNDTTILRNYGKTVVNTANKAVDAVKKVNWNPARW